MFILVLMSILGLTMVVVTTDTKAMGMVGVAELQEVATATAVMAVVVMAVVVDVNSANA